MLGGALHLTEDEVYYRLWAQAPALGYYDHPPMIAWWIWAGVHLLGDNPLGVRLGPILASAVLPLIAFDMARLVGAGQAAAARAGVWCAVTLLAAAGGFLATPDAPAALFWAVSLWAGLRAMRGRAALGFWLAAGGAAGLASLSKYSALFLGPGVLLWLVLTPRGRQALRGPGPWLALALAAGLFGLNLAWNASHHWLTFAKQFGRIAPHHFAPRYLLEFLVTEFVLLNPLLAVFLGRLALGGRQSPAARMAWPFLAVSAPFVAYLLVHSLHDRIQAHWPAPVYPSLAICAALAAETAGPALARLRPWVPRLGLGLTALAAVWLILPDLGLRTALDPGRPIRGWRSFAERVESLKRASGAAWVATASYGVAAQFLDEPALEGRVAQLSERSRWRDLGQDHAVDGAAPALLIDLPRRIDPSALTACYASVRSLGEILRDPGAVRPTVYAAWRLAGPRTDVLAQGCGVER